MEITFSEHARRQLRERNIAESAVPETVRRPLKIIRQSERRYQVVRLIRKRGKRHLVIVIYDARNSDREIVTAFHTSKLKKYL